MQTKGGEGICTSFGPNTFTIARSAKWQEMPERAIVVDGSDR